MGTPADNTPSSDCDKTCTLLKNAHDACFTDLHHNHRARQFGSTLASGLFDVVGVGGLVGQGISAAYGGTEKAGGLIDDDQMVSDLSSTLEGIRWGATQAIIETEGDVQESLLHRFQVLDLNSKTQLKYYEQLYDFETEMLDITQITMFICLSTAIFYILQHL